MLCCASRHAWLCATRPRLLIASVRLSTSVGVLAQRPKASSKAAGGTSAAKKKKMAKAAGEADVHDASVQSVGAQIVEARAAYYSGQPILTDAEFDALEDALRLADPDHQALKAVGAPISTPSSAQPAALPLDRWPKHVHTLPMGSLNKCNSRGELDAWYNQACLGASRSRENPPALCVTEKLDGISVSLVFEGGRLVHAATRGDGVEGQDILENVLRMQHVLHTVTWRGQPLSGIIRGEIVALRENEAEESGARLRNLAAGKALKRPLSEIEAASLAVMCYHLFPDGKEGQLSRSQQLRELKDMGWTLPNYSVVQETGQVEELMKKYAEKTRQGLRVLIDGLVVDVDSPAAYAALGQQNMRPKGAIAFKFANEMGTTSLADIEWQVGSTGRVIPVAVMEPVIIEGVTISRATLSSLGRFKELWSAAGGVARTGDLLLVSRRNDVIPHIERVVLPGGGAVISELSNCTSCGGKVEVQGSHAMCTNPACPEQVAGRIVNWAKVHGIKNLGPSLVLSLVRSGALGSIADLYTLTVPQISMTHRQGSGKKVGASIAEKCIDEIRRTRTMTFVSFLTGLGVPRLGASSAAALVRQGICTPDALLAATPETFASADVGRKDMKVIIDALARQRNEIERLAQAITFTVG